MPSYRSPQIKMIAGQAMTEFVVSVAFVFLVLFVCIPMFGKIMDMKFQNQQASRYIAWERTVWLSAIDNSDPNHRDFAISADEFESVAVRSDSELTNTMHNRFFNNQGRSAATFVTDDDRGVGDGAVSPIWTYVQSKRSMYDTTTVASIGEKDTPGIAYDIFGAVQTGLNVVTTPISFFLDALGGDDRFLKLDFNRDGYYAPTVSTRLQKTNSHGGGSGQWDRNADGTWGRGIEDSIFSVWDGVLTSRSGILTDGWSAQSTSYYKDRTDNLVLSNVFDFVVFDVLKTAASVLEGGPDNSAIYKLDFGAVGIEPMPADGDGVPYDVSCDDGFCTFEEAEDE